MINILKMYIFYKSPKYFSSAQSFTEMNLFFSYCLFLCWLYYFFCRYLLFTFVFETYLGLYLFLMRRIDVEIDFVLEVLPFSSVLQILRQFWQILLWTYVMKIFYIFNLIFVCVRSIFSKFLFYYYKVMINVLDFIFSLLMNKN